MDGGNSNEEKQLKVTKNIISPYGKVVLTFKNKLLPEEKLINTPSQTDGISVESERQLRIHGCELIQTAGILLKLPQVAMATGQVLLQRFYYSKSLVRHAIEPTAMACIYLASKIEEAPRRVRDVINVFTHVRQVNSGKQIQPVVLDQNYVYTKNLVIKAERRILKELGFCVHIKHPHKIIVMYLQVLGFQNDARLMQLSWNYMNDSLRTDVFLRYQPETVACACIYLTARKLQIPLPKNPHWFTIFGATENEIRDICVRILKLYNGPKPNIEKLEHEVEELREKYKEIRAKARSTSEVNSPSSNHHEPSSLPVQKTSAHNAWGGFISRSGSHMPPPLNGKRSRTRSPTPDRKHHKKSKKRRTRSRSPRNHKKSHKRKSYSRSRSNSPSRSKSRKSKDRRRSRSPSNDRDSKNDRYIDRYEKESSKYDRDSKYYKDDRDSRYDKYDDKKDSSRKYDKDDKYSSSREEKYSDEKYRKSKYHDDRIKDKRRRS